MNGIMELIKPSCNLFQIRDDNKAEIKFIHSTEFLSSFYVFLKCYEVKLW